MEFECPDGWKLVSLRELGEVNRGRSRHRPRYAEHLYSGPYPFIQTGDVKASNGRVASYTQTYSEAGLAQSRLWPAGTMCITIAANIAETGILTFPACFPDSVVGFIAEPKKADVQFVEYMFRFMRSRIQHQATGSVQDNINIGTLERLRFPVPSLAEQKAIAAVLGALDDKIELNRRMSVTLEAMAMALFQSWFVDFDPVRAKLDGRQPVGMDEATAALFPDGFEESLLGQIPKGWRVLRLEEIASVMMGLSPSGESYNADGIGTPLINGPMEFGDYFPVKTKWTEAATRFASEGDLIFCVRGSTTGRRVVSDGDYCIGRGVCAIRAKSGYLGFLYQTINAGLDRLLEKATGSVFPSLSSPDIKGFSVLKPSKGILDAYERTTMPLIQQIQKNQYQSRTLNTLRETLLPKLLSGELSVGKLQK